MLISVDRRQSRVCYRYVDGIFSSIPILADFVERRTSDSLDLKNNLSIEIHASSFRGLRGYSVVCAVLDEVAYYRDETSANPDIEIVNAIRPGMSNVPGALLLAISSPYARKGILWDAYKRFYGVENDRILVWQADSQTMNPTLDPEVIRVAYEEDEAVAGAEYGALFRRDIESFVDREIVGGCVIPERRELPYLTENQYMAFCDPSGGSSDSMTMAVSHKDKGGRIVLDAIRERKPPFSPEDVVKEFVETLEAYKIHKIQGDRYAGEWPRERFRIHGIDYKVAEKPKSDIYKGFLPLLNSKRIELLDNPRLFAQIVGLERRTGHGGRDSIDHGPGSHDDLANVVAGSLIMASAERVSPGFFFVSPGNRGPDLQEKFVENFNKPNRFTEKFDRGD